ncbi:MAG: hypothetical protein GY783_20975 [Gammaproteobacteria bacterium]|nr:hypothetical protein [Gammaproteobacteria bacterium]
MGNPLRDRRTAAEWAAAGQVIEIAEKLNSFEQLTSVVETDLAALEADKIPANWRDSVVAGELEFGLADAQRSVPIVRCKVAVIVDAVCQRCLEVFRLPLETEAQLLLLTFQETDDDYEDHEVWELEEDTLRPLDIVEELLIMAMPFSAMHVDLASCKALSAAADDREKMTKPFAALREQMIQD